MPRMSGVSLCAALTAVRPLLPILVVSAYASLENVAAAFRAGAYDYLCKPVDERQLTLRLTRACVSKRASKLGVLGAPHELGPAAHHTE
jgi:two-component system response regulator HydG